MNLEDESLLDAYLDDELDPASRLRVESALLASPALAEQVRQRAQVSRLVGHLPRPTAPLDVSAPVLAAIAAAPPAWYRRIGWSRGLTSRHFLLGAGLGIAAGLLLGFGLAGWGARGRPEPLIARQAPTVPRVVEPAPVVEVNKEFAPEPAGPPELAVRDPELPDPVPLYSTEAVSSDESDRRLVRALLDRPGVRRLFVVADELDEETLGRVSESIRKTFRKDALFGRIAIATGLVVDPDHPGQATVFALTADAGELRRLAGDLRRRFPGRVHLEDEAAPPSVVTMLADVGRVSTFEGTRAAGLVDHPGDPHLADRALKFDPEDAPAPGSPRGGSRKHAPARPQPAADAPRPGLAETILVWVCARP